MERSWQVTKRMGGDGKVLEDYKQHRGMERSCKVTNRKVGLERSWQVTNSIGGEKGPGRLQTG